MKKNFIPLLAVAFVVAIASTGIFYGLFAGKLKSAPTTSIVVARKPLVAGNVVGEADVGLMAWAETLPKGTFADTHAVIGQTVLQSLSVGEPVFESRLAISAGAHATVPDGMRAISIHATDSSGVLALLKPGHRVDAQVFAARGQGAEEARTVFQNLVVLSVSAQAEPSSQSGYNAPVVTVLATPAEADSLGVADSYGRIRLALRNPADQKKEVRPALLLAALLRGNTPVPVTAATSSAGVAPRTEVRLSVRLLSASPEGVRALQQAGVSTKFDTFGASDAGSAPEIEKVLARLRGNPGLDELSLANVKASLARSASVELQGRESGAVKVQFAPFLRNGQLKLKVQPEVTVPAGQAAARKLETEIDVTAGRSFVISGLSDSTAASPGRQLFVLVTPAP